ncbi:MAG: polyribonucleotide nucleotidyltransferase [Candidatus Sungbacteria bacterium RIFCSPHIGHO2_01_FULL_50_25]|uniref:Polyribonucleotide nucleotidyltransferase n=1 Tax=Candidatus Sungbacteria bacterium RIFCSPHIGHO2_01_FULL_50_25 TaxID=1802265 RepID=A0A1G2KAR5_9BACT|nr:MAG: polyribonucleotide nucleotidyltransferase [Candidatus Sungbacteria bacterium RIFCSPHIGHO2_01_FULL_50_25]
MNDQGIGALPHDPPNTKKVNEKTYTHTLGGKTFTVTLNNWAEQANGSVLVRVGDTIVLATATMNPNSREGGDFLPLTVDYEEKFYATGKILGSRFVKRETRPSEEAILVMRLIDRTIRPRFDYRIRNEIQIVITALSIDESHDPDILAVLGASLALGLSDIPWDGPIAGVRVSRSNGEFVLNPTYAERETSDLEVALSGTRERINMMEAGASEVSEEVYANAIEWGFEFMKDLIDFQKKVIEENGKPKRSIKLSEPAPELYDLVRSEFSAKIEDASYQSDKKTMQEMISAVKKEWFERAMEAFPEHFTRETAEMAFDEEIDDIIHRRIIGKGERPDGRKTDEIRRLWASVSILPRVHGSGLFMRGETHALTTLTLGAPGDEQIIEGMEIRTKKRFLHHYNFPPYSTGETKPMRGPGRREIGHGALAGKALLPVIPPKEEFPYTIRLVSEILSSNGSTSMAAVSASTLALMDGGVPIKKPVAGAAMGLVQNEKGEYRVLTDLQGAEDFHGDMDFKVAGTRDGITAVQLDVKIEGLTMEIIRVTLRDAHAARMKILDCIESTIQKPREELSRWAPRVTTLMINPEKIGALIGPGGKIINDIIAQTGAQIDIEDDGSVFITSVTEEGMKKAIALVKQVTKEFKPGELVEGRVSRLLDFGAFVEIGPKQDGLIHISELAPWRVEKVTDIVNIGDIVPVKIKNIDEQGRINLSLKDVPDRYTEEERARGREDRSHSNGGRANGEYHTRRRDR